MALFSLLVAILIERLKLLPQSWQLDSMLNLYSKTLFGNKQLNSDVMMALALILPAIAVQVIMWAVNGLLWGGVSLILWVGISILCFSHLKQRQLFKHYMLAACRGDSQACYHFAEALDPSASLEAVSEQELGAKVGQSAAWLNYRFYGAVAIFLIFLGPAGAVFYCTARYFSDKSQAHKLELPLVEDVLMLLDWLPSRIFAFGYLLSGQFSQAFTRWGQYAFNIRSSARDIVTQVALAAEPQAESSTMPICTQATLALLQLSKRNFILLLICLSILTIFGVVA
ncbi:beta-lactamase regulator AmpE [Shewanella sp. D64]|uniref:beta-lactamase regulator AmpE n=1 Tax=unclassified Shewanella TaxID=196818 RepID=UPI0022BA4F6B|nr:MULTISPECIES: beta-lactamase regulator AmpE [unclassified Shewanella]MEC4728397.1 beta-lactamase regulator AmpE [Shewanella sp. D64]MEC4740430.1 beta-lactamase regulator AmpE [Shewanella sp. E94]WBJ95056.1 beta-lactamase regulator AmpE [Shewanella sp. MTB7]